MPFEKLKRQLDLRKETANATFRREQAQQAQQLASAESQKLAKQRREAEKTNELRECFFSSGIDELTNDLVNLVGTGMSKTPYSSEVYKADSKDWRGCVYTETNRDKNKKYFTIKLEWDFRSGRDFWSEIDIGFLEDRTLVVDGNIFRGSTHLSEDQWRRNPELIEKALEKGFLHPRGGYRDASHDNDRNGVTG
ncbi:MAG: hypothetical protein ABH837_02365 [bacterium]